MDPSVTEEKDDTWECSPFLLQDMVLSSVFDAPVVVCLRGNLSSIFFH